MRSLVALATCCVLVAALPVARAHTKSPRAHAISPIVVAAAKDGIDFRTQMYLTDMPTPPAVGADQAEALYRMATCYHALKDDTQTTLILERLRRDHPKSGWASAHAMGNIWIWDEYLRLEASQENAVDGKE